MADVPRIESDLPPGRDNPSGTSCLSMLVGSVALLAMVVAVVWTCLYDGDPILLAVAALAVAFVAALLRGLGLIWARAKRELG